MSRGLDWGLVKVPRVPMPEHPFVAHPCFLLAGNLIQCCADE